MLIISSIVQCTDLQMDVPHFEIGPCEEDLMIMIIDFEQGLMAGSAY